MKNIFGQPEKPYKIHNRHYEPCYKARRSNLYTHRKRQFKNISGSLKTYA
ncbi:MAG: hypothetical protein IJ881_07445 [Neisseriaceae bacterium]|nr:hypothetical protein [Neisseriaceae bacterium]MBR3425803.1 hypothetical protein [Neisseriaceae bacterium]